MKIQVISDNENLRNNGDITVSNISSPKALDNYDINIIDLSYEKLWRSKFATLNNYPMDCINDLRLISNNAINSHKTQIIYVYPQNGDYKYNYNGHAFQQTVKIKDILTCNYKVAYMDCFPGNNIYLNLFYEHTETKVGEKMFSADFHFDTGYSKVITKSEISEKPTTICFLENYYFTTLNVCEELSNIRYFIRMCFEKDKKEDIPEWVKNFEFYNDSKLKEIIKKNNKEIATLQHKIEEAEAELMQNNDVKSILSSSGDYLVSLVFGIIEKLFDCDLSKFEDKKKADFIIEKTDYVIIGEIKGVNSNVNNSIVGQVFMHELRYQDDCEIAGEKTLKTYKVLIVNPFREKPIEIREPINQEQVSLAEKQGTLIIETITLLKMFELFKEGKVTSDKCLEVIKSKTGLLKEEDFNQ